MNIPDGYLTCPDSTGTWEYLDYRNKSIIVEVINWSEGSSEYKSPIYFIGKPLTSDGKNYECHPFYLKPMFHWKGFWKKIKKNLENKNVSVEKNSIKTFNRRTRL